MMLTFEYFVNYAVCLYIWIFVRNKISPSFQIWNAHFHHLGLKKVYGSPSEGQTFQNKQIDNVTFDSSIFNPQLSCLTNYSLSNNLSLDSCWELICHDDDLWFVDPRTSVLSIPEGATYWDLGHLMAGLPSCAVIDLVIRKLVFTDKYVDSNPAITGTAWLLHVQLGLSASCSS